MRSDRSTVQEVGLYGPVPGKTEQLLAYSGTKVAAKIGRGEVRAEPILGALGRKRFPCDACAADPAKQFSQTSARIVIATLAERLSSTARNRVGRGERGVLICQPYDDELVPLWCFKSPEEAEKSSTAIESKFKDYPQTGRLRRRRFRSQIPADGFTRALCKRTIAEAGSMPAPIVKSSSPGLATRRRPGPLTFSTPGRRRLRPTRTTQLARRAGRKSLVEGGPAGRYLNVMP